MAVYGDLAGTVADLPRDAINVFPLRNLERSICVTEVVEPDFAKSCSFDYRFELSLDDIVGI